MKKLLILLVTLLILSGCKNNEFKEKIINSNFKEDYESLNGTTTSSGKEYRNVNISDYFNSIIKETNIETVIGKIEREDSFYLYIGDEQCPWCRSVIEGAALATEYRKVSSLYYLQIWDENHEEVFRDKYTLENGVANKEKDGDDLYYKLLEYCDSVLEDYVLQDSSGNQVSTGEKRIYAPSFILIKKGKVEALVTGIPEDLEDPYKELTEDETYEIQKRLYDFLAW